MYKRVATHKAPRIHPVKNQKKRKIIKSKVANGKRWRQNLKDFGVANLEPVERDKYSGFSVNRVSENKRRPKEARKYDNQ